VPTIGRIWKGRKKEQENHILIYEQDSKEPRLENKPNLFTIIVDE
jgi:hypothetical protein